MPLHIIGAGFGRTGTTSLRQALECLGFPVYQLTVGEPHPDDSLWLSASKKEPIDYDSIFQGYAAAIDWPVTKYYQDIFNKYPHAKVILTTRDPVMWYNSVQETIFSEILHLLEKHKRLQQETGILGKIKSWVNSGETIHTKMLERVIWEGTFGGSFTDEERIIRIYNQHIEEVRRVIPESQLLIYNVGDGWEPLCNFLGVAVPSLPFPLGLPSDDEVLPRNRQSSLRRRLTGAGPVSKRIMRRVTVVSAAAGLCMFLFRHHGAIFKRLPFK